MLILTAFYLTFTTYSSNSLTHSTYTTYIDRVELQLEQLTMEAYADEIIIVHLVGLISEVCQILGQTTLQQVVGDVNLFLFSFNLSSE